MNIPLTNNGLWTNLKSIRVNILNRHQVWYILASDCDSRTHAEYPDLSNIEYQLELLNNDSQFSHEQWGMLTMSFLSLILFSYLLAKTAFKLVEQIRKEEEYESPLSFLAMAIYLEFSHLALMLIHLLLFWFNGYGLWWLEYAATIFEVMSQA